MGEVLEESRAADLRCLHDVSHRLSNVSEALLYVESELVEKQHEHLQTMVILAREVLDGKIEVIDKLCERLSEG